MKKQVNKISKNAYNYIRNLSKTRNTLDKGTIKTAANALVAPHLAYGNCSTIRYKNLSVEQASSGTENSAVRLIEKLKRQDSVSNSTLTQ